MVEIPADPIDEIAHALATVRGEMEAVDVVATRIARRTQRTLMLVMGVLALASLLVLLLVFRMAQNMARMNSELATMYGHFGNMTVEMRRITTRVSHIGESVSRLPGIAQDIQAMKGGMHGMVQSMEQMNRDTGVIDTNLVSMNGGMQEMTQHFGTIGRAVNHMQYNSYQMSAPMSWFPFGSRPH